MSFTNPTTEDIKTLLRQAQRIAIVGLSPKTSRPSHTVAKALQQFGYEIVPVRPAVDHVLGEKAYADLMQVPGEIHIVDVFRHPDSIAPIVDACIKRGVPVLWLQDGVVNEIEAQRAQAAGITVVMDRCIYRDSVNLLGLTTR
ncbi:MAG: CoA-binding protein [Gammaproteobacteria bacterium]|nr:CoA-binding protein [Gammaproteobacteria bacterium]MDH5803147.1 CoA-binding protein [Gammaproteobacteria bacterium]